ncbi:hypothetical protein [Staphylococcus saccharolyticus]|nr:hypothetical protein [Staphylococcus saccharolyticus]
MNWISQLFKLVIVVSFLELLKAPKDYVLDGQSFHGIFNNPNLFGMILVMGLVLFVVTIIKNYDFTLLNMMILAIGV